VLVNGGKSYFTGAFPEFWLFALGGLFIAVTLFFPKGIVGTIGGFLSSRKEKAKAKADNANQDAPITAIPQAAE
jgi:urea transport system permease protein